MIMILPVIILTTIKMISEREKCFDRIGRKGRTQTHTNNIQRNSLSLFANARTDMKYT